MWLYHDGNKLNQNIHIQEDFTKHIMEHFYIYFDALTQQLKPIFEFGLWFKTL